MSRSCFYCGTVEDTRPYGPDRKPICFQCMMADPEREKTAAAYFREAVQTMSGASNVNTVIVDENGVSPFILITDEED